MDKSPAHSDAECPLRIGLHRALRVIDKRRRASCAQLAGFAGITNTMPTFSSAGSSPIVFLLAL